MFKSADYGVVGFLFARGFDLDHLEQNGAQVVFCFISTPALVAAVGDYTSNTLIPCRDYFHGLRRAKSTIQDKIRHEHTTR